MQLITFLSTASALIASVSANAVELNKVCNQAEPVARVVNRCDYPVHLWSVLKGNGCPSGEMITLQTGDVYNENLQDPPDGKTGISIKISKTQECKGSDIVQLEYFRDNTTAYNANYLDVSYVDCLDNDCPTKSEGYYLVSGSQTGDQKATADNKICPILSCHDAVSCAKMSYILPDDVQTKSCKFNANLDFYMCGGNAPTEDYGASASAPAPSPSSSTKKVASSSPAPSATSVEDSYKVVAAAAVTPAPKKDEPEVPQKTKTNVEVVYVTAFEYVNAKRHTHGHARRHQAFHA